jgi:hypothetical protein
MLGFCSHTYSEGDTVRALLGEVFYTVTVTDTELWLAVVRVLQRARLDKKWKVLDVERAGGPTYKTVQMIEEGQIGTIDKLTSCARALGLTAVDILAHVIETQQQPLSPEAAQIVRKFAEMTVEGRTALLATANALAVAAAPSPTAGAATPPAATSPRPGRRAARRRKTQ